MEDTGGSVTEGSAQVLRGTGYAVNYTPKEGYETSSVFVDGEEIDLEEYPDRYVIENIQENHTVDVTFAVKPTPIPTPTEKPQEITKPSQAESIGTDESGDGAVMARPVRMQMLPGRIRKRENQTVRLQAGSSQVWEVCFPQSED